MMEENVAQKVEEIFKDQSTFIRRYNANSNKVFSIVSRSMKVVPYNLKYLLYRFYKELTTSEPDDYVA
jgi:hypothetical protein